MSYSILKNIKENITTPYKVVINDLPDSPNDIIVLRQIVGFNAEQSQSVSQLRGENIYSSVNILMRLDNVNSSYENINDTLDGIVSEICELIGRQVGDKFIGDINNEEIDYIGKDVKQRHLASVNLNIMYYRN